MKNKIITSLVILSASLPVAAHHGFGRFLMNTEIVLEGTLTGLDFVNPHSYVYFDAAGADGKVTKMRCEMRAATVLRRSGWSQEMFKVGTHIKVTGRPHRDDSASCYVENLEIGKDISLERYQQLDAKTNVARRDRPLRLPSGEPNISGDWAQEQYLIPKTPGQAFTRLVPKSLVGAVERGEIAVEDTPDAGWRPAAVTLTAAGNAASKAINDLPADQNPRLSCQITSILLDWVFDGPVNRITQAADKITIEYGRGLTRVVHMNMSEHPDAITPSRGGHSIGRWDGDTLVIDTVGFLPGIVAGTVPNSASFHVIERFTLDAEAMALNREYVAEDPEYYKDQYRGADKVNVADAPFAVDQCKELAPEYMK